MEDVPEAVQVSEFLSRFKAESYIKIVNNIPITTKPYPNTISLHFLISESLGSHNKALSKQSADSLYFEVYKKQYLHFLMLRILWIDI